MHVVIRLISGASIGNGRVLAQGEVNAVREAGAWEVRKHITPLVTVVAGIVRPIGP